MSPIYNIYHKSPIRPPGVRFQARLRGRHNRERGRMAQGCVCVWWGGGGGTPIQGLIGMFCWIGYGYLMLLVFKKGILLYLLAL